MSTSIGKDDVQRLKQDLQFYYSTQFHPEKLLQPLIPTDELPYFEIVFEFADGNYSRRRSYSTWKDLQADCVEQLPRSVHIGPRYMSVSCERANWNIPRYRLLKFDIDADAYDDVRQCCSGKSICALCWNGIMLPVTRAIVSTAKEHGIGPMLCVFSGSRGVHVFCSQFAINCALKPDMIQAFFDRLGKMFLLVSPARTLNQAGAVKWSSTHLQTYNDAGHKLMVLEKTNNLINIVPMTADNDLPPNAHVVTSSFIRLDAAVTLDMNHLSRIPYSIHPTTQCIRLPFDPFQGTPLSRLQCTTSQATSAFATMSLAQMFPPVLV